MRAVALFLCLLMPAGDVCGAVSRLYQGARRKAQGPCPRCRDHGMSKVGGCSECGKLHASAAHRGPREVARCPKELG